MVRSITVTPDKDGKIHLTRDGDQIVITIAPGTGQPTAASPNDDPFGPWFRNVTHINGM